MTLLGGVPIIWIILFWGVYEGYSYLGTCPNGNFLGLREGPVRVGRVGVGGV